MARKWIWPAAAWAVVVVAGVVIFAGMRHQPLYWDAAGYVSFGTDIHAGGLFHAWPWATLRTYGYPLFIAWMLSIAHVTHLEVLTVIFAVQWALLVGSAWLAARALFRSPRTRLIAFVAVAANPLLVVYSTQALTEGVTLPCVLFSTAALGCAVRARSGPIAAAWLAAGAVTSGFALVVRPGNVLVPVCYVVAALVALVWTTHRRSWLAIAVSGAAVLVGIAVPLAPQAVLNWHDYRVMSVLPVTDLASLQAGLGMKNIRYATNVAQCGDPSMAFPNQFVLPRPLDTSRAGIATFYALDWPVGPETAALHVFSGLDPRPFLTYQVAFGAWYERPLQGFTVALLGLACLGLARAPWSRRRITPEVAFLGAVTVASVGILATSQTELRFGVILVTAVSLLAASAVARLRRPSLLRCVGVLAVFGVTLLLWFVVSDLILASSPAWVSCR